MMFRIFKWWENEKELRAKNYQLETRRKMYRVLKNEVEKLQKENNRMREIICCVSDKVIKEWE